MQLGARHVLHVKRVHIHLGQHHVSSVLLVGTLVKVHPTVLNAKMEKLRQWLVLLNVMNAQLGLTLRVHFVLYVLLVRILVQGHLSVLNVPQGNSPEKVANLVNPVVQHDSCSLLVRPVTPLYQIFQGHASGGNTEIAF